MRREDERLVLLVGHKGCGGGGGGVDLLVQKPVRSHLVCNYIVCFPLWTIKFMM